MDCAKFCYLINTLTKGIKKESYLGEKNIEIPILLDIMFTQIIYLKEHILQNPSYPKKLSELQDKIDLYSKQCCEICHKNTYK